MSRVLEVWHDSFTGLTWTTRDNGRDVSWKGAVKYCRALRVSGYADWRLANMFELQGIYDPKVSAPGRAGDTKGGNPSLACRARFARTQLVQDDWPPLLRQLWREQHPDGHEQAQQDFGKKLPLSEPVSLFMDF